MKVILNFACKLRENINFGFKISLRFVIKNGSVSPTVTKKISVLLIVKLKKYKLCLLFFGNT